MSHPYTFSPKVHYLAKLTFFSRFGQFRTTKAAAMLFFFAWEQAPVTFDPTIHARMDMDIFTLTLTHEEGTYARARLTISPKTTLPPALWGVLSTRLSNGEIICLFQGARSHSPTTTAQNRYEIELIACPPDADTQLQKLLVMHKDSPFFEPLLFSETQAEDPQLIRLSRPVHFYWDPRMLTISLSSLFEGKNGVDVTNFFITNTLKFHCRDAPLSQIKVTLGVQWVQRATGFMNLSASLAKLFSEKVINTFTGNAFKAFWPRTGQRLARSGYWIAYSKLIEIPPPEGGRHSPPLRRLDPKGVLQTVRARRRWFQGKLLIGWQFQQKRIEKISFTVLHAFQKAAPPTESSSSPPLFLALQPICPDSLLTNWAPYTHYDAGAKIQENGERYHCIAPHRSSSAFPKDASYWQTHGSLPGALPNPVASSFFVTDRGQKVLEAGLEIAKTLLASHSRAFEFSFDVPLKESPLLSPQDQVSLADPRLPQGKVTGKVVSTTVKICGQTGERILTVVAKASFGNVISPRPPTSESPPVFKTPSGLSYFSYKDQTPQDPYAQLALLRYTPLIKKLALLNGPDIQEKSLTEESAPLQNKQTRILLKLKKLYTRESLSHEITVTLPDAWASPQQIIL